MAVIPAIILRDFTPANELRYLSIADDAISTGRLFAFTYNGEPYADKPPLYLWLVMLSKWLGGGEYRMWILSLFSLIPFAVCAWVMREWTKDLLTDKMQQTAALVLATFGYWFALGLTIRMDMLMCMFIVLAMWTWWRNYTAHECQSARLNWLFAFFTFMALFTKGPVGVLVPVIGVIAFSIAEKKGILIKRSLGWRFWLLLISLCALWWFAAWLEGGSEYIDNLLFKQTVGRAVNSFRHNRPFYYYAYAIWYTFAPWSPLVAYILVKKLRKDSWQQMPLARFMLIVALVTFVMLSLFSSKIEVYLLPMAPFLVYGAILLQQEFGKGIHKVVKGFTITLLVVLFVAGCCLPLVNDKIGYRNLSEKLIEMKEETGAKGYVSCGMERFPAIDTFLKTKVKDVSADELPSYHDYIIVTNERALRRDTLLQKQTAPLKRTPYSPYIIFTAP